MQGFLTGFFWPFLAFDAFVQKHFDRAVHEVMRRTGATKRDMRRHGWAFALGCTLAVVFLVQPSQVVEWPLRVFIGAVRIFVHVALLLADDWLDARAEASPTARSSADYGGAFRKVVGWFGVLSLLTTLIAYPVELRLLLEFGVFANWLYQGYLGSTSPQAPAKQKKTRAALYARTVEA